MRQDVALSRRKPKAKVIHQFRHPLPVPGGKEKGMVIRKKKRRRHTNPALAHHPRNDARAAEIGVQSAELESSSARPFGKEAAKKAKLMVGEEAKKKRAPKEEKKEKHLRAFGFGSEQRRRSSNEPFYVQWRGALRTSSARLTLDRLPRGPGLLSG